MSRSPAAQETGPNTAGSAAPGASEEPDTPTEEIVQQGIAGARVFLFRGIVLRIISVTTGVALVTLVAPGDLGLLAVVRGAVGFTQFASELGFEFALLRRREQVTRDQLASYVGMRILAVIGLLCLAIAIPAARSVFGLVPAEYSGLMLLALGSLLLSPIQSACKIRLERGLQFRKVALVEVNGILLQNVGLVLFALAGWFAAGVFLIQAGGAVYYTVALLRQQRLEGVSFDWRPLRPLWREGREFTFTALLAVTRESVTPVLVGKLFNLQIAGFYAFAVRTGQFLLLATEGYIRAGLPVAARLAHDAAATRRFTGAVVREAAAITYPLVGLLFTALPLVGLWLERWTGGVGAAQTYLIALGVLGSFHAALWPTAVATQGPRVAVIEHIISVVLIWLGLAALAAAGGTNVGLPLAVGIVGSVAYLHWVTDKAMRPRLGAAYAEQCVVLVFMLGLSWLSLQLGLSSVTAAGLATLVASGALLRTIIQRWPPRVVREH